MASPLDIIKNVFTQWLDISQDDRRVVDYILSLLIANRWPGDPLWGYLVGPPGSMKTELLRTFRGTPDVSFISNLRARAIQSGYRGKDGKDPSLLPTWDGKTIIFKDFTAILTKPKQIRESIIGDLRDAYDSFADLGTGTVGMVHHQARFGVIAAVTPAVDGYWSLHQQLGERFLSFRLTVRDRMGPVQQSVANIKFKNRMRKLMAEAAAEFLKTCPVPRINAMKVPKRLRQRLEVLADLVAHCRSSVTRTGYGHALMYVPSPELGTRIAQQLAKLTMACAVADGRTAVTLSDYGLAARVGRDCLSSLTAMVLRRLYRAGADNSGKPNAMSTGELVKQFSHTTLHHQCEDLQFLGVVDKVKSTKRESFSGTWRLKQSVFEAMKLTEIWVPIQRKRAAK